MPLTLVDCALRSRNDLSLTDNGSLLVVGFTVDCSVVPREKAPALEVTGTVAVVGALPHPEVELRALEAFSTRVIMPDTVIVDVCQVCGGAGWFVLFWKWRGLSLSISWSEATSLYPLDWSVEL